MALASRNPEEKTDRVALKSETLIGLLQLLTTAGIGAKYIYIYASDNQKGGFENVFI